jgi:hydroxyquinol 1,2-dioxygenase
LNVASPAEISAAVEASFTGCADDRLRTVLQGLVRHLHAFAMDVGLTEAEWRTAIDALTESGRMTDERRQEFILWSDALGLSMLIDAIAHPMPDGATSRPSSGRGFWWSVENDIVLAPAANALGPPR